MASMGLAVGSISQDKALSDFLFLRNRVMSIVFPLYKTIN
jgi:hypothetical protein